MKPRRRCNLINRSSLHIMSHHHTEGLPYCQNCHYPIAELDKFCPNCGQQNTDGHVSLHDLWHELTHYFTHVDNKIFTSIRDLLIPGKLTDEFFKGHRKRYIQPINLFFVLGIILPFIFSQMWKSSNSQEGFMNEKELYHHDLLYEMDSILKVDTNRYSKADRVVLDSFLLRNYQRTNKKWSTVDTSERGYTAEYSLTLDKIKDSKKAIKILNDTLQVDKANGSVESIKKRLEDYQNYYQRLKLDSITYLRKIAQLQKVTMPEAEKKLQTGVWGYNFGKNLALKGVKMKPLDLDSILKYPVGFDPSKIRRDSIRKIIKRDSLNIGFITGKETKVDEIDAYTFSSDEIIEKYNIEGYWSKLGVKQFTKFGREGFKPVLAGFAGKSIWISVFTILPAAWFLFWMYRQRNRLYVEHVVFLIHYSCFSFAISPLMLIDDKWGMVLSSVLGFCFLILAVKRFYKQNWGKSILKSIIFYIVNMIFSLIITLLGFLLIALFM